MITFARLISEAIEENFFKEQVKTIKGLTFEGLAGILGARYTYIPIYFSYMVFESTLKSVAQKENMQYRPWAAGLDLKSDLYSIGISVESFKMVLTLKMNKNGKNTDIKKAVKSLNALVKALDAQVKQLKIYGKIVSSIKDLCIKHKKAPGDVVIKGAFDAEGKLYDITLSPPRGRDVDSYFNEDFVNDYTTTIKPLAKKAGIGTVEIAGSSVGNMVYNISGLNSLK